MRRPPAPLAALAAGAACVDLVASAQAWAPAPRAESVPTAPLDVAPSSVTLACPPGVTNPFKPDQSAPGGAWSTTSAAPLAPAPATVTESGTGAGTPIPSAFVVAGQGGGELAGLSVTGCSTPLSDQWLAAGATTSGSDVVLTLANPSATASTASIEGYGGSGRIGEGAQQVRVPAGKSVSVLLAGWFPDETNLAVRVSADAGGVAAWAQTSVMDGEIPQGASWGPSVRPSTTTVIPGIEADAGSSLRIAVPSAEAASVSVTVHDDSGSAPLPAGDVTVDGRTAIDIPLDGMTRSKEPVALSIASDRPVVAQVTSARIGAPWTDPAHAWVSRSVVSPASPVTRASLPGAKDVASLVTAQLAADPLRATSVETPSGVDAVRARIILLAAGADQVDASVGGQALQLSPGTPLTVDLPASGGTLTATAPVTAALVVEADTPVGTLHAAWSIGTLGITATTANVVAED